MKKVVNIFEILFLILTILLYFGIAFPDPSMSRIHLLTYTNGTSRRIVSMIIILILIVRIVFVIRYFLKSWQEMKEPNKFERRLFYLGFALLSLDIMALLDICIFIRGWWKPHFIIILAIPIFTWSLEFRKRHFKFISIKLKR